MPTSARGLHDDQASDLVRAATLAIRTRTPLVVEWQARGTELTDGLETMHAWGLATKAVADCSGVVPIAVAVSGPVTGAAAFLLGLADVVVMTPDAIAYMSGPASVRSFTGEILNEGQLGGPGVHGRTSGVASLVAADRDDAHAAIQEVLSYLPDNTDDIPEPCVCLDPPSRATPEAGDALPAASTGSYDVRSIISAVADDGDLLELRAEWAPNLVTGLVRMGGRPVGVVANQPNTIAGTLDIPASQKGARFVAFCDAFNVPLLTFVDTPGFYPGKDLEWRGMIRHGAQLAFAYARATVPRVCVILRKSYGGAHIVMDSKTIGNDLVLAWPTAEIAVMGAKGAAEILHRRASPEERLAHERAYEAQLLTPWVAADRGLVDAVIEPSDTRRVLCDALEMLVDKQEMLMPRPHDNTPL